MSTESINMAAASQPAAPETVGYGASAPAAASAIPMAGTNTGSGSSATAPDVVPIATPAPPAAASSIAVATPEPPAAASSVAISTPAQPATPGVSPVGLPNGTGLPSPVTQEQLNLAVTALQASIAAGTKPVVTRPDGTKEEITIDNNNTIGVEPVS